MTNFQSLFSALAANDHDGRHNARRLERHHRRGLSERSVCRRSVRHLAHRQHAAVGAGNQANQGQCKGDARHNRRNPPVDCSAVVAMTTVSVETAKTI